MKAYIEDCEENGVRIVFNTQVNAMKICGDNDFVVTTKQGKQIHCENLINSAGLWAQQLAERTEGFDKFKKKSMLS